MSGQFEILRAGPGVTVQDLGRPGLQRFGVPEGGVLDRHAHHAAAALLGNPPELASLELLLSGVQLRASKGTLQVAVTGRPGSMTIDGTRVPSLVVLDLPAGSTLDVQPGADGAIAYVGIGGGVATEPVLGSRSTHARAGLGGLAGTSLQEGDVLAVGPHTAVSPGRTIERPPVDPGPIRVVWAMHAELFDDCVAALDQTFAMTAARDRMGAVLQPAEPIPADAGLQIPSAPVVAGDLQVPGDGRPVALLADRQPTGGYPRLATIIGADLDRFSQLPVGAELTFEVVGLEEAVALHRAHRRRLETLPQAVGVAGASLWGTNLISGITVGDEEPR